MDTQMHTKYDRYRRAPADAGQKEITERGRREVARCGVFFFLRVRDRQTRLERQVMQLCLIRALSFAVFTHFRPSDDSKNRFINRETDSHTSIKFAGARGMAGNSTCP